MEIEGLDPGDPFVTDVTFDTAPGPALYQTEWGPDGPNKPLENDKVRLALIEKCFRGNNFSGKSKRYGSVR